MLGLSTGFSRVQEPTSGARRLAQSHPGLPLKRSDGEVYILLGVAPVWRPPGRSSILRALCDRWFHGDRSKIMGAR